MVKKTKRAPIDLEWVCEEIMAGRIDKHQIVLDSDYASLYRTRKGRSAIDLALDTAQQAKILRELIAFNNKEFTKTVVFVEGEHGAGKTLYVSALIECSKRLYGWKHHECISKQPFYRYDGSEIIVFDDMNPNVMSDVDWVHLLDNYHTNEVSINSAAKQEIAPRVIVLTSTHSPIEFFRQVRGVGKNDPYCFLDQILRRISIHIKIPDTFTHEVCNSIVNERIIRRIAP